MQQENKYLNEFFNFLTDDQVFYCYLTNTFMLKQISVLMESIKDGSRTESEVNKEIESLIQSLGIISPEVSGLVEVELTREDFYNLIKSVKGQSIENLAERRKN
jgi:hypothetical protein